MPVVAPERFVDHVGDSELRCEKDEKTDFERRLAATPHSEQQPREVSMFVVILTYIKSLDVVDAHVEAHVKFLKENYEEKVFIASGRQVPRTGGVILARAANVEALQQVLEHDPFFKHGVAEYKIIEFVPSMVTPEFSSLLES